MSEHEYHVPTWDTPPADLAELMARLDEHTRELYVRAWAIRDDLRLSEIEESRQALSVWSLLSACGVEDRPDWVWVAYAGESYGDR